MCGILGENQILDWRCLYLLLNKNDLLCKKKMLSVSNKALAFKLSSAAGISAGGGTFIMMQVLEG